MRLKTIKLSGFKSFVDPTVFHAPSNLIGIVGPNGCGKSNIIDAIRWVMGETSAKQLRGDNMSDVIFNGSNTRKPVGTATVELLFDNNEGRAGGEYAKFSEISVKRQVSRDGHSAYFLNNTRCRKRDITDLFLGTGLGPRSYSIIEQGMISQIVDSKPEDLRNYLEEAAGISKYKERRRETENRIRHTRENLERLDDLRQEVEKQLRHLDRQAKQAEKYKLLKDEERTKKLELVALNWRAFAQELEQRHHQLNQLQTDFEAQVAKVRATEAEIERLREAQATANEQAGKVQGEMYEVGGEIARVEQAIAHRKDLQQRQRQEHEEAERAWQELQEHMALDRVQVEELTSALTLLGPQLTTAQAKANEDADRLRAIEADVQAWQEAWDAYAARSGEQSRQAEVEKTRIDAIDQRLQQSMRRLESLSSEQQTEDPEVLRQELADLQRQHTEQGQKTAELDKRLAEVKTEIAQKNASVRELGQQLDQARQQYQRAQGRVSSLEALQQAALGEDQESAQQWLTREGLAEAKRLAQAIEVESGWEAAVETVLDDSLEAVLTNDAMEHAQALANLDNGLVLLADEQGQSDSGGLSDKVRGPRVVDQFLAGVQTAENLFEAVNRVAQLSPGQSIVTRDGEWLGPGWIRVRRGELSEAGVLVRERELNQLREEVGQLAEQGENLKQRVTAAEDALAELDGQREELQMDTNMGHRREAELGGQVQTKQSRLEHLLARAEQVKAELSDLQHAVDNDESSAKNARGRLQQSLDQMADSESEREQLEARRKQLHEQRDQIRSGARASQDSAHQLALQLESKRAAQRSTEQAIERMMAQLGQVDRRRSQLLSQVEETGLPLAEEESKLKALLDRRLEVEGRLSDARKQVEELTETLRNQEQLKHQVEEQSQQLREKVESEKLDQQSLKVKAETLQEDLAKAAVEAESLLATIEDDATPDQWDANLEILGNRIRRLEPVNLAAIQEREEQSERKKYLDEQNEDLLKALDTLEQAIHKIDKKTRTRFKETFDRVNTGVQQLFPRLIGGGHAYLELTGDDLLTTGVTIMARPPGKRVSNIHLLSGGEKALTAVAFVFAIFQLNPAPFCLLDEVDAPLDDANVARFSQMVREMSEQVQFIVITHNKLTMEVTHQLSGVTMREPGVSRLVTVDIAEAERMVNA